jgi:hypothetical protein
MTVTPAAAREFASSPAQFFDHSWHAMQHVERERLEALQLAALRLRFADLRDRLPTLTAMAGEQDVTAIDALDDVVPLLFEHSVYKSYPVSLLQRNRFDAVTRWLDRLTTHDLSGVDVSRCEGIDDWLDALDTQTPLRVAHSSGTAGTMSFLPRSQTEWDRMIESLRPSLFGNGVEHLDLIWPGFRHGRGAITRLPDMAIDRLLGSEERLHVLRQGRMSADAMFLAAQLRAAQARGEVDQLEVNPSLLARREEFEQAQRELLEGLPRFIETVSGRLAGKRIWLMGTWNVLHAIAQAGLEAGLENVFAADSLVTTGGGAKGQSVPDGWDEDVKRFVGVDHLQHAYGMSELTAINKLCEHGRYHLEPWLIGFVLDPETGRPLPREGTQTGRAAFFDLIAESYWGGFITGDEVTADWEPCACGRTTLHLARQIERFSDKRDDDDKITCAASDEAHASALEFLTERRG